MGVEVGEDAWREGVNVSLDGVRVRDGVVGRGGGVGKRLGSGAGDRGDGVKCGPGSVHCCCFK